MLCLGGAEGEQQKPQPLPEQLAAYALVPPVLNTAPLPAYDDARLDFAMNIGIERTKGGRIWACWVGNGDNDTAYFVLATSDNEGQTWSKPRMVIDPHDRSLHCSRRTIVGNLWTDPSGKLWLFFDQSMAYFDGRAGLWATTCENPDAEKPAWSEPRRIWDGCALNKPIVLSNGTWLLVSSLWHRNQIKPPFTELFTELDPYRMANVLASSDQGKTWERRGGVLFDAFAYNETHLVERRDGSLWMTTRTNRGIFESSSADAGRTWTQPVKSSIGHVSSRHHLRRLASGRLLLIKHGVTVEERTPKRSHLSAFLSEDDGYTWKGGLLLDERENVSYPDGFQSPDGTIFISYDHEREKCGEIFMARFTEADILAGSFRSAKAQSKMLISKPLAVKRKWLKKQLYKTREQLKRPDSPLDAALRQSIGEACDRVQQAVQNKDSEALKTALAAMPSVEPMPANADIEKLRKPLQEIQESSADVLHELDTVNVKNPAE